LWDIHCKQNFINYVNKYKIYDKNIHISEIGFIIQIETNYVCFMSKHPQEYNDINVLLNGIISVIHKFNIKNIISFSTAGSNSYKVGSVIQFYSAIIEDPSKYKLNINQVTSKYILEKTNIIVNDPITDTKGFKLVTQGQSASGQDEFVIYLISNKLNIPCITFTGISDNNNVNQYHDGGGNLAAKNAVEYFYTNFNF